MLHAPRIPCAALVLTPAVAAIRVTRQPRGSIPSWFPPSARPRPPR